MITKSEAQAAVATFQNSLANRINLFLKNRASSGFVGGVFNYTPEDTGPQAQAARTELQAGGWTVVVDTVARTVTIS